jgi:hypothetical protein
MLGYLEAIKNPRGNNPVAMTFETMEHYRIEYGLLWSLPGKGGRRWRLGSIGEGDLSMPPELD